MCKKMLSEFLMMIMGDVDGCQKGTSQEYVVV